MVRIELRRHGERRQFARHRRPALHRGAELIDVGEHLRHGGEQRRRDLAVEFGMRVQCRASTGA